MCLDISLSIKVRFLKGWVCRLRISGCAKVRGCQSSRLKSIGLDTICQSDKVRFEKYAFVYFQCSNLAEGEVCVGILSIFEFGGGGSMQTDTPRP